MLTFVANRAHPRYAGRMEPEEVARYIASGQGPLGTCRDHDPSLSPSSGQACTGAAALATVDAHLAEHGLMLRTGTVADGKIIAAPSSTKNMY